MSTSLHQIMYISTASAEMTDDALLDILSGSQKRNRARGITGLLLHSDGNIIQVMEGPENAVKKLYQTISQDKRHRGVTLMSSQAIEKRDFPEYKMGFKRTISTDYDAEFPGFTDVVEKRSINEAQLAGLSKLVAAFIKTFAKTTRIDRFESGF